ncbi:hypothetical protein Theam_1643 [Thermovibrio ammonificans HB-1]|uniref:Uncharacterized protein n=1 Tax=Thermovibrio ammonificans (strain DSM 15698 / JCM 12110 / HB-1) TaxID=648996 RepID=E8T5E5_THEA1|nr:hypothetical protein Theam_1643 [Thermovibrio ammonificans HB-1]
MAGFIKAFVIVLVVVTSLLLLLMAVGSTIRSGKK